MTRDEIASRIEAFVRTQFAVAPTDPAFNRTASLFELGYIDSVGVVELLAFLHDQFGVRVPDAALLSEDFQTLDGIAGVVHTLRENGGRAAWRSWVSGELPAT